MSPSGFWEASGFDARELEGSGSLTDRVSALGLVTPGAGLGPPIGVGAIGVGVSGEAKSCRLAREEVDSDSSSEAERISIGASRDPAALDVECGTAVGRDDGVGVCGGEAGAPGTWS